MEARKTKPFPWVCPDCRQKTVVPTRRDYSITGRHGGELYDVTLHDILVPTCPCGGAIITSEICQLITAELKRVADLRTDEERNARFERE